jgi:hypothetical protein
MVIQIMLLPRRMEAVLMAKSKTRRKRTPKLGRMLLAKRHLALQREIWFAGGPEVTHGVFSRLFAHAMQEGLLRHADPDLIARLYCDTLSGHILDRAWLGIGERTSPVKRTIDAAIDLFLKGYATERLA